MKNDRPGLPQLTRRDLFRVGGVTVAGYSLLPLLRPFNVHARKRVQPRGTAEVCIFYFLQGAMSHVDTFDLKEGKWTPEDLDIRTFDLKEGKWLHRESNCLTGFIPASPSGWKDWRSSAPWQPGQTFTASDSTIFRWVIR